jgi:hypothetical protein
LDLWSSGRVDLGLTDEQFWSLTVREHKALVSRLRLRERNQDRRFALIAAVTANCHRDPAKRPEPFTEADFMPGTQQKSKVLTFPSVEDQIEMAKRDTEILKQIRRRG